MSLLQLIVGGHEGGGGAQLPSVEESSSAWSEQQAFIISTYCMCPLSCHMQQRLILQYLTPMGEYQELLTHIFEHNAMELIFYYIDLNRNTDARLAFEATKVRLAESLPVW